MTALINNMCSTTARWATSMPYCASPVVRVLSTVDCLYILCANSRSQRCQLHHSASDKMLQTVFKLLMFWLSLLFQMTMTAVAGSTARQLAAAVVACLVACLSAHTDCMLATASVSLLQGIWLLLVSFTASFAPDPLLPECCGCQ